MDRIEYRLTRLNKQLDALNLASRRIEKLVVEMHEKVARIDRVLQDQIAGSCRRRRVEDSAIYDLLNR